MTSSKILKLSLTYLIYSVVFVCVLNTSCFARKGDIHAKPLEETRINYQDGKFKNLSGDKQMYEFTVTLNPETQKLEVIMNPNETSKEEGWSPETYETTVIHCSDEFILFKLKLATENKVDMMALYLPQRIGYLISTKAYLGLPKDKLVMYDTKKMPSSTTSVSQLLLEIEGAED